MRGFNPDTAVADLAKTVPLGRVATPDDIANVVCFLASKSRAICADLWLKLMMENRCHDAI